MIEEISSYVVINVIIAVLVGLLIGMEREYSFLAEQEEKHKKIGFRLLFAGARTFAMVALLGCVGSILVGRNLSLSIGIVVFLIFALIAHVVFKMFHRAKPGMTTELELIATFVSGSFIGAGELKLGILIGAVAALMYALTPILHSQISMRFHNEIHALLKLVIISIIIYPVVPDLYIEQWLIEKVPRASELIFLQELAVNPILNLNRLWFLIVLISCISFFGYICTMFLRRKGLFVSGFIGGLYSSTITSLHLINDYKGDKKKGDGFLYAYIGAVNFSYLSAIIRAYLILWILSSELAYLVFPHIAILFLAVTLASLFSIFLSFSRKSHKTYSLAETRRENPLSILSVLKIFGLVLIVLIVAKLSLIFVYEKFAIFFTILLGLLKVESLIIALSQLTGSSISTSLLSFAFMLGLLFNFWQKVGLSAIYKKVGLVKALSVLAIFYTLIILASHYLILS